MGIQSASETEVQVGAKNKTTRRELRGGATGKHHLASPLAVLFCSSHFHSECPLEYGPYRISHWVINSVRNGWTRRVFDGRNRAHVDVKSSAFFSLKSRSPFDCNIDSICHFSMGEGGKDQMKKQQQQQHITHEKE